MSAEQIKSPAGTWQRVIIGAVIGGVGIGLLFRTFFCYYTFQEPSIKFLFWGLTLIYGVWGNKLNDLMNELAGQIIHYVAGGLLAATLVMLFTTFLTPDLTKNYCVPDFEILKALIDREGEAVITRDIDTIHAIYTADAVVSRIDTHEAFQAYTYYSQKFATEEHCAVTHADYLVMDYSRTQVTVTTSSMGSYGALGAGCTQAYSNPPGSDEWVFRKIAGEWQIVRFAFNKNTE